MHRKISLLFFFFDCFTIKINLKTVLSLFSKDNTNHPVGKKISKRAQCRFSAFPLENWKQKTKEK